MEAAAHLESVEKCDMSDSDDDDRPVTPPVQRQVKNEYKPRIIEHVQQQAPQHQSSLNFDTSLVVSSSLSQLHFQDSQMIPNNNASLKLYHDYNNPM